ncbi:unnamed protein product [Dibothriocephalus latus]|uniref:Myosin tail domain-containing protein n=1 Tax=Dibothriocephalus latus TaxID=60516 RepID=A0A3P6UC55_DIBLA|nr:unnamed protein product [Dibothriocephalus latus]
MFVSESSLPSIPRSPTAFVNEEINTPGKDSNTSDVDKLTGVFSPSSRDAAAKENLHSLLFSPETYNESEHSGDNSKIFSYGETEDDVFLLSTSYSITVNEEITKDDSKITRGEKAKNEQASIKDEVESTEWPLKSAETKLPKIVVSDDTDTLRSVRPMPRSEIVPDDNSREENSSADTRFYKKPPPFSQEPCGETESGKRVAGPKEEQVKDENGEDQANNEQKQKNTTKHDKEPLLLDQNLTESQNQQTDLVKETSMVTTELTLLGQSNSKLQNENMALNLQIQELKQELAAAKDEVRAMKGRLERSELRATNLKKQLQTEESRRKIGALKQKQVLLNQALEAKEEAEQAKQKQLSLEAQRLRLENQLKEVTARASMAEHDRQVIDRQHSRLRTMSVDLQKELDSTQQARQEALNSTRQLEQRLQLSEKQRAESIEALDKATKESRKMRRDRDNVQEELKRLQKTKSELVLQNLKLSEDLAEQKSDLSDMQLALNEKREREKLLTAKLEDAEAKLRAEEMKTERLEANTKSLEKTIKDLRDNLSAMSKESPPQQQKMTEMEQLLSLVREQLRSEQEKSQAAAREARAQGRKVRECTMLLEQKKIAAVELQGKFDKLEAAHGRLKHERETMEDEISRLRIQKRAFSRDLETLTEKIRLLEQERESLLHKLNYQQESTWPELSGAPVSSTPPDVTSAA